MSKVKVNVLRSFARSVSGLEMRSEIALKHKKNAAKLALGKNKNLAGVLHFSQEKPANSTRLGKMTKEEEGVFVAFASHARELFSGAIGGFNDSSFYVS